MGVRTLITLPDAVEKGHLVVVVEVEYQRLVEISPLLYLLNCWLLAQKQHAVKTEHGWMRKKEKIICPHVRTAEHSNWTRMHPF